MVENPAVLMIVRKEGLNILIHIYGGFSPGSIKKCIKIQKCEINTNRILIQVKSMNWKNTNQIRNSIYLLFGFLKGVIIFVGSYSELER